MMSSLYGGLSAIVDGLMKPRSTPFSRVDPTPVDPPLGGSPPPDVRTIAVIGAGSSGLVAAKYLVEHGFEVTVFEKGDGIGGTFVTKAYDDAGLVSSKFLTAFSDLRSPASDPPHLSLPEYCAYVNMPHTDSTPSLQPATPLKDQRSRLS